MSGAGGEEVGRISIRVLPELGTFRAQMDAAFEKYDTLRVKVIVDGLTEAKAKIKDVAKDVKATVKTDADVTGMREKIKATTSGIRAKVAVDVDDAVLNRFERRLAGAAENAVSKYEPNLNLTVQDEKLRRSIEDQLNELKGLANLPVALDPEIATKDKLFLEAEFKRLQEVLQAHANAQPIKFKLEVDKDWDRVRNDIDKLTRSTREEAAKDSARDLMLSDPRFAAVDMFGGKDLLLKYRADIDYALAEAKAVTWEEQHRTFAVQAKIKPDADMSAFARAKFGIEAMFSNIRVKIKESKWTAADLLPASLVGGLDEAAKGLTKVGVGAASSIPSLFSFAGILLVVLAAVAVLLPPLLALAAGFITLAPAFLALIAPAAAIALGLDGIKKAATDAGLFADGNGDKKGGGTVGAALQSIKDAVSGEFAAKLTEPFRQLGAIMPALQEPMVKVAAGLSDIIAGFIGAVTEGAGLDNVKSIIANMGQGLTNAAPGVRDFTSAILELVQGISTKFPGLGKWFSDFMAGFKADMIDFTKPGEDGISRLDTLIANVRKGIEGLTGIFQSFWNQGLSSIQDPSFGQHMLDFFNHVRDFVTVTLPTLANGFEAFASFLNTLTAPFERIGNLIDKINKIPGIGVLKDLVGGAIKGLNPALGAYDVLNQQIQDDGGKNAAKSLIDQNAAIQQAAAAATAAKQEFDKTIQGMPVDDQKSLIAAALGTDTGAQAVWGAKIATATAAAQEQITSQFDGVKTAVAAKWVEINAAVTTGVQGMQNTVSNLFTTLPQGFQGAFTGIQQSITGMFILVSQAISTQSATISNSLFTSFQGVPARIGQALAGVPTAMTTALSGVGTAVSTAMGQVAQATAQGGADSAAAASASFAAVPPAIQGAMSPAIQGVAGICQQLVSTAVSFGGAMESAGYSIGASFAKGIANSSGLVSSSASALLTAARAFFPNSPADKGPFSGNGWVDQSGEAVATGFASGIDDGMQRVISVARELMQAIKDVFGSADGLTLNFNFGGAMGQMNSMAGAATNYQSSMAGAGLLPTTGGAATISTATKAELDVMKQENAALDVQIAQLREKKFATDKAGKAALDAQIAELNARKATTTATIKQTEYEAKYGEQAKQTELTKDMPKKIADGISNVGQGVIGAYASDLGIGTGGALGALADYGMQFGSQYIFNVATPDDAERIQQARQRQETMTYGG